MVFEHKCVLAVYEQNHPRMIQIHPVSIDISLRSWSNLCHKAYTVYCTWKILL